MTVGKDVTRLFADVLKCMQTEDVELKKLVYLYLMNHARKEPDLVILAVNTFCKDTEDPSPLVRALALRTMACIRVERIADYLCEPLHRTLKDESPYVRKTAAICVAKLWQLSPDLVEEHGFLEEIRALLADPNPSVLASAVSTLAEIAAEGHGRPEAVLQFDVREAARLLAALPECSEWAQVALLDALSEAWAPRLADPELLARGAELVLPRMQHANPAVVMAAMRLLLRLLERSETPQLAPFCTDELREGILRKLGPPLVALLASPPEVQFVALRTARALLQRYPSVLASGIRVLFCKYTDPAYVKAEKLALLVHLADGENVEQILPELADYAKEVDVDFSRRAIRTLGAIASKLPEAAAQPAIELLATLAETDVRYVAQEALVTARSLLRRLPGCIDGPRLARMVRAASLYDDPESRAALLWLLGEQARDLARLGRWEPRELLAEALESFKVEPAAVQAELFSTCLKLYLAEPDTYRPFMMDLVARAMTGAESIELRDRATLYERLLSLDPALLRSLNLPLAPPRPAQDPALAALPPPLLALILGSLGSLASVYHRPPESFVTQQEMKTGEEIQDEEYYEQDGGEAMAIQVEAERPGIPFDLLEGLDGGSRRTTQTSKPSPSNLIDLLS